MKKNKKQIKLLAIIDNILNGREGNALSLLEDKSNMYARKVNKQIIADDLFKKY